MTPHLYSTASKAHMDMVMYNTDQSIISYGRGDSEASENLFHLMEFYAEVHPSSNCSITGIILF